MVKQSTHQTMYIFPGPQRNLLLSNHVIVKFGLLFIFEINFAVFGSKVHGDELTWVRKYSPEQQRLKLKLLVSYVDSEIQTTNPETRNCCKVIYIVSRAQKIYGSNLQHPLQLGTL